MTQTGYLRREREIEPAARLTQAPGAATSSVDPLHLAFQLVLAGHASPGLLQSLQGRELLEALTKASQELRGQIDPGGILEVLERQRSGVEPNALWLAWLRETRKTQLKDLVDELYRAGRRPKHTLQSDEQAEATSA